LRQNISLLHERNTEEENNGYVVLKMKYPRIYRKLGGGEGRTGLLRRAPAPSHPFLRLAFGQIKDDVNVKIYISKTNISNMLDKTEIDKFYNKATVLYKDLVAGDLLPMAFRTKKPHPGGRLKPWTSKFLCRRWSAE
jgi:hypothetical protein